MKIFKKTLVFLIILSLWELVTYFKVWSGYILPSPITVLKCFFTMLNNGEIFTNIGASLYRIIIGFFISALFAVPLGFIFGLKPKIYEYFKPLFEFMRNTPPLALIPMLILWFGIGEKSKIIVIILASFFPIFLNTLNGVLSTDNKLLEVGISFKLNRKDIIKKIIMPSAMPDILVGLKLGIGYSWRAIIGAEMIAASSGLGYLILDAKEMSRSDEVIVGIILIGTLGILTDKLFGMIITKSKYGRRSKAFE